MSLMKKLKDILFEEEEYTEPIKIREEKKQEEKKNEDKIDHFERAERFERETVNPTPVKEEKIESLDTPSERELFKRENTFKFPDFDEEEFQTSMERPKQNNNVLDYERKKSVEIKNDYSRIEKVEKIVEKKKFKPSPIISPVYGILNQDYKAEDIKNRNEESKLDIDEVRKKAFEVPKVDEIIKEDETISEPVVTFFEEKDNIKVEEEKKDDYKSINDLLDEASEEIPLEDTLELPKANNLDVIEEELEKIDEVSTKEDLEDSLNGEEDNDLFELIDSMYDEREEG